MYPVLVGGGGLTTVLWDFRHVILSKLRLTSSSRRLRRANKNNTNSDVDGAVPIDSRRSSETPEQEVDRIERIELPELGSGAEDTIRPVVVDAPGVEQPEQVKYRDGKYDHASGPAVLPTVDLDVERQSLRQRQTRDSKQHDFPQTVELEESVEVVEHIQTLPAKTAAAIFVLFVALVVTFVVLKSTLSAPSRGLSLFTKSVIA